VSWQGGSAMGRCAWPTLYLAYEHLAAAHEHAALVREAELDGHPLLLDRLLQLRDSNEAGKA